jgi:hypothetical protein
MSKKRTIKIDQESFARNPNKFTVDLSGIKVRKTWKFSPAERILPSKKSKTETREETKKVVRNALKGEVG